MRVTRGRRWLSSVLRRGFRPISRGDRTRRPRWHSVSSCSEYQRCPRRYRFQYVDRVPAQRLVPPAWRYGTVVHRALEVAYRNVQEGVPLETTIPDALTALDEAWIDSDMPDDPEWFERAQRVVEQALESDTIGPGEVLGVEEGFGETLSDGIRLTGYADLVLRRRDRSLEIIDHKVTRRIRSETDLADDAQLNLYGWLAQRKWPGAEVVRASHHYPLTGELVGATLTDESMNRAVSRLADIARTAEADKELVPLPGEHCSHCPWSNQCEASVSK